MVKHGRNKKRRAGRIGRTKLKNRNYALFKPPQFQDPVIKNHWDPKKSARVNMESLGLQSAPNTLFNVLDSQEQKENNESSSTKSCKAIELYDIPESDIIPKSTLAQRMLPVSIENQKYMAKCFAKHGEEYFKMSRDIKVNDMQHTENHLRKLGAKFLLLKKSQRRVDIPEKIRHLIISD
mmetsp:Transcript_18440/g.22585  ORF Transcript_18440/g.22585 Transcript_18440/m.22585 type:complete len:180 (-) Transcript_18440:143-682(-)